MKKSKHLSFTEILVILIFGYLCYWRGYSIGQEAAYNKIMDSLQQSSRTALQSQVIFEDPVIRYRDRSA